MGKKGKWEEILELEVQDLQNMMKFSAKDLTWTQVFGDQVAVIPYARFADFIRGEQSIQNAPTHFVVNQERVRQEEEITHSRIDTYLEYAVYWCAYGPESNRKVRNDNKTMSGQVSTKKTRIPRESIKVGCRCHFIMRRLFLKPEHAIIIYTHCRHVDKSNIVCHGKDAIGRPQMFNYAPHLSSDIRAGVEQMIKDGFSVTMIWNKFIYDVEHKSGELFTGLTRDTLMTRQDILNIYHNIKRKEYVKGDGRVHAKKKTMDKKTKFSMQEQRNLHHTLDHGSTYEDALGRVQQSAPYNIGNDVVEKMKFSIQKQWNVEHTLGPMQHFAPYNIVEKSSSHIGYLEVRHCQFRLFSDDIVKDSTMKDVGSNMPIIQSIPDLNL